MSSLNDFSDTLYNFHKAPEYKSIETLCSKAKEEFLNALRNVDEKEFVDTHAKGATSKDKKNHVEAWMSKLIDEINNIVKRESDNDMQAASDFYELLFLNSGNMQNKVSTIKAKTDFYRMRSADNYLRYDRKGLFLISDKCENLVGTYRYNPSGYACLYLASNLYLAWEESRRPDFDKVNFSRFQNTQELRVLNVTISRSFRNEEDFLMAYLTLLCSAKTTDKKEDKHNFQYIVPHLIMKALCHSQRQCKENKEQDMIHGIKYLSSRRYDQKDFLFQDKRLSIAYVFPQHPHDDTQELCPFLAKLFKLTAPRSYFLYKTHRINLNHKFALTSDYDGSLFQQLEQQAKGDKLEKYDVQDE